MMSTISDTLAMAKDTIARVKILEQDSISDTTAVDSVVAEQAEICSESPVDLFNAVWDSCCSEKTINLMSEPSDTAYEELIPEGASGVFGIPVSGDITQNDIVTSLVLVCFFITMTFISVSRNYIGRQTKKFFGKITARDTFTAETINEVKLNIYFVFQTCLIFSILTYIFATSAVDVSQLEFPLILVIPAATILYLLYFVLKLFLYTVTDIVFSDGSKTKRQHTDDLCYITTVQGLLLFPALLLAISTGIDTTDAAIYVAVVIVFAKLIAFYKTFSTFSGHYKMFLQIILYFCALEVVPLMSLCGIVAMIANYF